MVKDTMNTEILKDGGARTQSPGSSGNQCANNVSPYEKKNTTGSPFVHCGKAELSQNALYVNYESFGTNHDVLIGLQDLSQLISSRFAPAAPVKEIRTSTDGVKTAEKIGYACRTASGKALKINTIHSNGDLTLPWVNLLDIVNHKRNSAPVSRLAIPEAPRPAPARDIRAGLERGL